MNKLLILIIVLVLSVLVLSPQSYAAAKVNYLKVEGEVLVFSTNDTKEVSGLNCVNTETKSQWSLSLRTQNGQSSYTMLLTAVANDLAIEVTTAGDCKNTFGIERASLISLSQ